MISADNLPLHATGSDTDFTVEQYRQLLQLAKKNYKFATYDAIPFGERFVLWRHDCDYSLNRARRLAEVENEAGICATYFINPHCEFYNPLEADQARLIREILAMGHKIGVHFDAAFYSTDNERQLDMQVQHEAALIHQVFGVKPTAFSFHNPNTFLISCDQESYGGLLNCYSKRLKSQVAYCSDSNGYWRFRRLHDVLSDATDSCLQILTHPGWWQESPMPPRQRIFRSVYGRAESVMRNYDDALENSGRVNQVGGLQVLRFIRSVNPDLFELCDYLWNQRRFDSLFIELWRLHESQIRRLSQSVFLNMWNAPASKINSLFQDAKRTINSQDLLRLVFDNTWLYVCNTDDVTYQEWLDVHNQLLAGFDTADHQRIEKGCIYLCNFIKSLAAWGRLQPIKYDGLDNLRNEKECVHEASENSVPSQDPRWESLERSLAGNENGQPKTKKN